LKIVPTAKVIGRLGLGRSTRGNSAFFDPGADIAFFKVRTEPMTRREERPWGGAFEYNRADEVVGVEVRFASAMFPADLLRALPAPGSDR
jgi:hypothetical protein